MLDPQVQIRIIDLARELSKVTLVPQEDHPAETAIKAKAKYFDQAYKALLKTVEP